MGLDIGIEKEKERNIKLKNKKRLTGISSKIK